MENIKKQLIISKELVEEIEYNINLAKKAVINAKNKADFVIADSRLKGMLDILGYLDFKIAETKTGIQIIV